MASPRQNPVTKHPKPGELLDWLVHVGVFVLVLVLLGQPGLPFRYRLHQHGLSRALTGGLVFIALCLAMWVQPLETLREVTSTVGEYLVVGHGRPVVFGNWIFPEGQSGFSSWLAVIRLTGHLYFAENRTFLFCVDNIRNVPLTNYPGDDKLPPIMADLYLTVRRARRIPQPFSERSGADAHS